MKIGIDIDGVLTNYLKYALEKGLEYCTENNVGKLLNPVAYDTTDMFGWDDATDFDFWFKNIFDYAENNPVIDNAADVINKLKDDGNEIYIITARWLTTLEIDKKFNYPDDVSKKMRNAVKDWLKKNNINYDYLIFSGDDKSKHIKENSIDVMIEDSPRNVKDLSYITKVICYNWDYNKHIEGNNIYRCYDWNSIYNQIELIKNHE